MKEGIIESEKESIDTILSRIGFGLYQMMVFGIIGWFWFTDGCELVIISIISKVLEKEWNLSSFEIELMGGVIYLGMILGTITLGPLGDKFGRRTLLIVTAFSTVVSGILSGVMPDYWSFILTRMLVGASIGGLIPGATTSLVEVCTVKSRGIMIVLENLIFQAGVISIVALAMWLVPDLEPKHWRELLILAAAPGIFTLILLYIFLDESPRFLAIYQQFHKSARVLNKIARYNKKQPLNEYEIKIITETEEVERTTFKFRWNRLMSNYKRTTFQLCYGWFSVGFVYYGLLFILPRTISSQTSDSEVLMELLIVNLIQLPTPLIPALLMEVKWIGRKNILLVCSVVQCICSILCAAIQTPFIFEIFVTVLTFFDNIYFHVIYAYTSELFDTSVRGTGFSIASAFARFAGFISPFLLLGLHDLDPVLPYVAMSIVSFLTIVNSWLYKSDTTNTKLDIDK